MIVVVGDDGHATPLVTYANSSFARLVGRATEALVGQSVQVLASAVTDQQEFARLIDAIERQRAIDLVLQVTGAGARRIWVEAEGRPLAGEHRPYLLHLRDVTAQRSVVATAQRLEHRFDALAKLTSDGVYHLRTEPDCRLVLDWTAGAFERLTGYGAPEVEALGGWTALVDLRIYGSSSDARKGCWRASRRPSSIGSRAGTAPATGCATPDGRNGTTSGSWW